MLYYKEYTHSPEKDWVVFVHGAGGSSTIWYRQIRDFKKHFNVLLLDLRGHGKSKHFLEKYVIEDYTFQDVAGDILEVLDHLKIEKAHFIGISLGTIIIRSLGEFAPERIKSLTLGGAIIRLNIRSKFLMWFGYVFKKLVPYMWLYSFFAWTIMPYRRHRFSRSLFIQEAKRLAQKEFLRWYQLTLEVNPLLRYFNEKELKIPTLYIMGDEDHMFLPQVRKVVTYHEFSQLEVLDNCGHVVNVDQTELFNQISIKFISNPLQYQVNPVLN